MDIILMLEPEERTADEEAISVSSIVSDPGILYKLVQ